MCHFLIQETRLRKKVKRRKRRGRKKKKFIYKITASNLYTYTSIIIQCTTKLVYRFKVHSKRPWWGSDDALSNTELRCGVPYDDTFYSSSLAKADNMISLAPRRLFFPDRKKRERRYSVIQEKRAVCYDGLQCLLTCRITAAQAIQTCLLFIKA